MIKYSVLLACYNRAEVAIHNTFISYLHHYKNRDDYEFVIIEDNKNVIANDEYHKILISYINKYKNDINIIYKPYGQMNWYNPAPLINEAARIAKGEFYVITGLEMIHINNIFDELNKTYNKENRDHYIIGSCENIEIDHKISDFKSLKYKHKGWYQHSKDRNRMYYFISCIRKNTYWEIGGINEIFSQGCGSDDVEFLYRIKKNKIPIILNDNIYVTHQKHGKYSDLRPTKEMRIRNSLLGQYVRGLLVYDKDALIKLAGYIKNDPIEDSNYKYINDELSKYYKKI